MSRSDSEKVSITALVLETYQVVVSDLYLLLRSNLFLFGALVVCSEGLGFVFALAGFPIATRGAIGSYLFEMIRLLVGVMIAVNWHRHVILKTETSGLSTLRFKQRELKFYGVAAVLFTLIFIQQNLPLWNEAIRQRLNVAGTWSYAESLWPFVAVEVGLLVIVICVAGLLSLVFPQIAIDKYNAVRVGLKQVRGNAIRILLATAIATFPFYAAMRWGVANLTQFLIQQGTGTISYLIAIDILAMGLVVFNICIAATCLSLAYVKTMATVRT